MLRLNNKHPEEIPRIKPLLEIRLFLSDESIQATQGKVVCVLMSGSILILSFLSHPTNEYILIESRELGKA